MNGIAEAVIAYWLAQYPEAPKADEPAPYVPRYSPSDPAVADALRVIDEAVKAVWLSVTIVVIGLWAVCAVIAYAVVLP